MMNYESINLLSDERIVIEKDVFVYFVDTATDLSRKVRFPMPAGSSYEEAVEEAKKRLKGYYSPRDVFDVSTQFVRRKYSSKNVLEEEKYLSEDLVPPELL